jgi:parkin
VYLQDCDLGEQSILHAVRQHITQRLPTTSSNTLSPNLTASPPEGSSPMCSTLMDLQLNKEEREMLGESEDKAGKKKYENLKFFATINFKTNLRTATEKNRAHFYVYCGTACRAMKPGKLRVRCSNCKSGAVTVTRDPCSWEDVINPNRVEGHCESPQCTVSQGFVNFTSDAQSTFLRVKMTRLLPST